jgi:hypothetical protein
MNIRDRVNLFLLIMGMNNLRLANLQGMNLIEHADPILPERYESFQALFIIDKKTGSPIIILLADPFRKVRAIFATKRAFKKTCRGSPGKT